MQMNRVFAAMLMFGVAGYAAAGEITVSAAASLTNALRAAAAYEAAHPGDKVLLNFGASDALAAQIARGAPVDVFASADQHAMDKVQAHLAPGSRRDFTSNELVVAVPVQSALRLRSLADLGQPAIQRLTTGNPASVPAGRYARAALEKAGLWAALEPKFVFAANVRQSLDYIARGEAEAGLVYQTDVASQAGKVRATRPTRRAGAPLRNSSCRRAGRPSWRGMALAGNKRWMPHWSRSACRSRWRCGPP
jgi:molybdate transport system substrate-binding protein